MQQASPVDVGERLAADEFIDRYCIIESADGGPPRPFRLWDFQRLAIEQLGLHQRLLVLKARQLGLSWLADAYALWECTFLQGQTVLMFSYTKREADEELRRIRFMHARLPDHVRRRAKQPGRADTLEFPDMDSRIISLPSAADAGTSFTATRVIVQEMAKIQNIESLMTAVLPTLSAGGKFLGVSTAKGYGNLFEQMWRKCEVKLSDHWEPSPDDSPYSPLFVPSSAHPLRDDAWHDETRRAMASTRDFMQEYPETPEEAFQATGDTVFGEYFSRTTHACNDDPPTGPDAEVWRGIDFGWHAAPVYYIEVRNESVAYVFDELYIRHATTQRIAEMILERDKALGLLTPLVRSGVDPAGGGTDTQTAEPDILVLRKNGIPVEEDRDGQFRRVAPKDRVTLIQSLLENGRLLINPDRCPELALALEQAEWDHTALTGPPKLTYKKDGRHEHALDAIGYALINIFPLNPGGLVVPALVPTLPSYLR